MGTATRQGAARASVVAALVLIALKLGAGLSTGSLGLLSEAVHSGVDLVAALLVVLAVGVAQRPADRGHPYGHGKAEHLSALAEASVLVLASLWIGLEAISRLLDDETATVSAPIWVFGVLLMILVIDALRAYWNWRIGRREDSAALRASATHFAGDFLGTAVVTLGLIGTRLGHPELDAWAALVVAGLVIMGAAVLARGNVMVLMDTAPADALRRARRAVHGVPGVEVGRLRLRHAGGAFFADIVVRVPGSAAVGQGHAVADEIESAVRRELPGADVVVHVEPTDPRGDIAERARAAALTVRGVLDVHNLRLRRAEQGLELSFHFRLPGGQSLEQAHATSQLVERAVADAAPELHAVHTHIEPLGVAAGQAPDADELDAVARRVVEAATGRPARSVHLSTSDTGIAAQIVIELPPATTLDRAHDIAHEIEDTIAAAVPGTSEIVVHTEPAST